MILGQLRIGARQAKNAPLLCTKYTPCSALHRKTRDYITLNAMQAPALQRRTTRLRLVGLHTTTQSGFPHRPPDSPDSPLLTCSDRRRITSSATVFHLDSSLLAAFLLCDTDMGLSSMGLLLLPLCLFVSARPQNRDLVMEDILEGGSQSEDSKVDVDQAFDLKIDAVEGAVNNSNLVQSMALSCPPPVATFLRFGDKVELGINDNSLLPDIWSLCVKAFEHSSFLFQS